MAVKQIARSAQEHPSHTPFNHDSSIDPNILAVQPDDPYSLLMPDETIQEGDIKRLASGDGCWTQTDSHEWGYLVPKAGFAYARVTPPEGYLLGAPTDLVAESDLIWLSHAGEWSRITAWGEVSGQTVGYICKQYLEKNTLAFIAHLNPKTAGPQQAATPTRHRDLFPGESLRNGDKLLYEGLLDWVPVEPLAFGQRVNLPDITNGNCRYCRPVDVNFQHWYVDNEKGTALGLGGVLDPWPTVEMAMQKVESAARVARQAPHGSIWNKKTGIPMMVYDLPTPSLHPVVPPVNQELQDIEDQEFLAAVDQEEGMESIRAMVVAGEDAEITIKGSDVTLGGESSEPFCPDEADTIAEEAKKLIPKNYRLMVAGEEAKEGDLFYGHTDGDPDLCTWQKVTGDHMGADPAMYRIPLARKIVPVVDGLMPALIKRFTGIYVQIGVLYAEMGQVAEEMQALLNKSK